MASVISDGIITGVAVIGPTTATIKKIKDVFRHMIYVKSMETEKLIEIKDRAEAAALLSSDVRISFDLDPMGGY